MLVASCGDENQPTETVTSTMKAADPPADTDTATESAGLTTQTTEVGEERSPQEGGALTETAGKPVESGKAPQQAGSEKAAKPGKQ